MAKSKQVKNPIEGATDVAKYGTPSGIIAIAIIFLIRRGGVEFTATEITVFTSALVVLINMVAVYGKHVIERIINK